MCACCSPTQSQVFAFVRTCKDPRDGSGSDDDAVLLATNLDRDGAEATVTLMSPWVSTAVTELMSSVSYTTTALGNIENVPLASHGIAVFVPTARVVRLPPVVTAVSPAHDELVAATSVSSESITVSFTFDASDVSFAEIESVAVQTPSGASMTPTSSTFTGPQLTVTVPGPLAAGLHHVELKFSDRAAERIGGCSVSYTHLTLPTICSV
eukprot:2837254-Prymnesium_polylepis.2